LTVRSLAKSAIAAAVAAGIGLALLSSAGAASAVQVTAIDCLGHPRKVAIQNKGDTTQNLAGWKLLSDKPSEVFDLGAVGAVAADEVFYVFNGHLAPPAPQQSGGSWIYPWNYTETYDEAAFVLHEDGVDFIRLVDASQFPWREVSVMPCPGTLEIPPLQQPETPTPTPQPAAGNNPEQTPGNQTDNTQTSGNQQTGGSQNVPAGNTTAGTAAQTGNVSDQALGGPSSGIGVLSPAGGGAPFAAHPLPLGLLSVVAGAALALLGARTLRRALRRP